jgi:hypothetical protein
MTTLALIVSNRDGREDGRALRLHDLPPWWSLQSGKKSLLLSDDVDVKKDVEKK